MDIEIRLERIFGGALFRAPTHVCWIFPGCVAWFLFSVLSEEVRNGTWLHSILYRIFGPNFRFFLNHLNRFSRSYMRADSTVSAGTAVSTF